MHQDLTRALRRKSYRGSFSQAKVLLHFAHNGLLAGLRKGLDLFKITRHRCGIVVPEFRITRHLGLHLRLQFVDTFHEPVGREVHRQEHAEAINESLLESFVTEQTDHENRMLRNRATTLLAATHTRHHSHPHAVCTVRIGHVAEHVAILRIVTCAETKVYIVQEPFPFTLLTCDTPLFHIVVRPVAIVHEHFGLHIVHVVIDINLVGNFLVIGIVRQFVTLEPINHRLVIGRRARTRFVLGINQVDIRCIKAILGFVIVLVVALT